MSRVITPQYSRRLAKDFGQDAELGWSITYIEMGVSVCIVRLPAEEWECEQQQRPIGVKQFLQKLNELLRGHARNSSFDVAERAVKHDGLSPPDPKILKEFHKVTFRQSALIHGPVDPFDTILEVAKYRVKICM